MWTTMLNALCLALVGNAPHARTPSRPAFRRPSSRLQMEPLEDRLAPATTLTWTGAVSQSGYDPRNWAEGRTPEWRSDFRTGVVEYFDLSFPANVPNKVCDFTGDSVAANAITFLDDGYTIRGGSMDLGKPGIVSFTPHGTNTIETKINLDEFEPNSEAIPFWAIAGNVLRVTANITNHNVHGSPSRELHKFGGGTLILSGNNQQDSTVLENDSGTLSVGSTAALGVGPLKLLGGTLQSSGPITLANPIVALNAAGIGGGNEMLFTGTVQIQPGASLTVANTSRSIEFNNVISGQGRMVKTGAGSLTLGGNNTYSGGTEIREGTLAVKNNNALGEGRLKLIGGTLQSSPEVIHGVVLPNPVDALSAVSNISGINSVDLNGSIWIEAGATLTVDTTPGGYFVPYWVFRGDISGPGSLRKTGDGHLDLTGNNSYAGGTEIREGSLAAGNEHPLGGGLVKLSGGRLVFDTGQTLANPFEVSGSSSIDAVSAIPSPLPITFTGAGTLLPGSTLTIHSFIIESEYEFVRPREIIFSGAIGGAGALTKTGDGQLTLSGTAANTYTGTTTVNRGILFLKKPAGVNAIAGPLVIGNGVGGARSVVVGLGAANQIADTTPVTVNTDGLLKLNNFSDRYGPVTGKGKVTTADPPTMTVAFDDILATFEGEISGPGIVVKEGTGTWILAGANTYGGGTVVAGGTLLVDGSIIGPVTVGAGATLGGTGTTGPVTLSPGASVSPGGAAPGVQAVQDLALSPGSSYAVQLNGPDPGTGYDQLVVAGTVSLNDATLDASLGFSPEAGERFVIIQNDGADPVSGTFAGLPRGAALWIGGVPFHVYYDGGDGNDVELVRNAPPAVALPGDRTAYQNVGLAVGGIRVGDPDDGNLTMTLQVGHGTLTLGAVAGLTVVGDGTSSVTLSGGIAALNAALAGLLYRPDHNYGGADVLAVTASDGLDTTSGGVAIRVKSLAEQAADLRAQVNALRDAGVLNRGRANSLAVKLDLRGNDGDIGRVQAFLHELDALLNAGILSPAQAEALLGAGDVLLTGLRRR